MDEIGEYGGRERQSFLQSEPNVAVMCVDQNSFNTFMNTEVFHTNFENKNSLFFLQNFEIISGLQKIFLRRPKLTNIYIKHQVHYYTVNVYS